MNLGLENINLYSSEDLGITSVEEFYGQLIELNRLESQITSDIKLYNTLDTISSCIKKYGVTESINFMYGENFSSTASMEAEVEEHKKSLFKRIIESIAKFIRKVINFFKDTFNGRKRMIEKLKEIRDHADEYELPVKTVPYAINTVIVAKLTDWDAIFKEYNNSYNEMLDTTIDDDDEYFEDVHRRLRDISDKVWGLIDKLFRSTSTTISTTDELKKCCSILISWLEKFNKMTLFDREDIIDHFAKKYPIFNKNSFTDPEFMKIYKQYVQMISYKASVSESFICIRELISNLKKKQ